MKIWPEKKRFHEKSLHIVHQKGNGKDLCDKLEENVNKLAGAKTSTVTGWNVGVENGQWKYSSGKNYLQKQFFYKITTLLKTLKRFYMYYLLNIRIRIKKIS